MSDLLFDGFTLSPEKLSLRLDDTEIKLEPRLTELLVYLVQHRDRVVGKDELIETVWQGRFVGDSAISRAIYEVRRALGDDSKRPQYLRTVHGRGYQFIGELENPSESAALPAFESSVNGPAPAVSGPSERSAAAEGQTPLLAGRDDRRRALPWLLGLLLVVGVSSFALRPKDRPDPGSQAREVHTRAAAPDPLEPEGESGRSAHVRLALSPILASEHAPDLQLVAFSLTDLLYQRLRETPGLVVRAPTYGDGESRSMESLATYVEEAGAEQLLIGVLERGDRPDTLRIELELVDFEGGRALTTPLGPLTLRTPASSQDLEEFLALRDAVVDRVLDILGSALLPPAEDPSRPRSYAAYRLFLLAHQAVFDGGFCDSSGVIELVERSLEIDPEYPPAWTLLAIAHANQVWACGASAENYDQARQAIERAVDLAPTYIAPWLVESVILIETGNVELAYERSLEYVPDHSEEADVLGSRIYSLRYSGFLNEAKATMQTLLAFDPLYYARGASGESPNTLLYLGEYEDFLATLPPSDAAMHLYYRGLAEFLLDRPERAREVLEPAFRTNPAAIFARYAQALLAILDQDLEGATLIVDQIVRQRDQLEATDGEMSYKEAQLYVLCHEYDKALKRLEESLNQGYFSPRYMAQDPLLRAVRDHPRFVEVWNRAVERHVAFARRFGLDPDLPS